MIKHEDFRIEADRIVDWIDHYFERLRELPVKSRVKPREIYNRIASEAPLEGEEMERLLKDLDSVILPGITHSNG